MPQSDEHLTTIDTDELHRKAERYKRRATQKPRGTRTKGNSLAPLWIVLILVVAGSVAGILSIQNSRKRERLAAHLLNQNRNRATEARKSIEATATKVQTISRSLPDYENGARAAILRVVGRPLVPDDPAFPTTAGSPTEPTASAQQQPAAPAETVEDPDAPPGLLTRAELERRRNRSTTPKPDMHQPIQEVAPTREDPAIWTLGQDLLKEAEQIRAHASVVEEYAAMARRDEREILHDTRVDVAVRKIAHIQEQAAASLDILKKARRSLEQVKVTMASITQLQKIFDDEERHRLAQEEKRRKEKELQDRKKAEIERVVLLGREADDLITNLAPEKAMTLLVEAKPGFTTEEARKVLALYIEQCERVGAMKTILIETFNAEPVRWGWRHGGGQRDITGANEALLKVTGGTVPWIKVPDSQFSYMALQYVLGRWKMPASKRSAVGLGTAILLAKRGNATEAAIIAEKLVYKVPSLASQVERLVELY